MMTTSTHGCGCCQGHWNQTCCWRSACRKSACALGSLWWANAYPTSAENRMVAVSLQALCRERLAARKLQSSLLAKCSGRPRPTTHSRAAVFRSLRCPSPRRQRESAKARGLTHQGTHRRGKDSSLSKLNKHCTRMAIRRRIMCMVR